MSTTTARARTATLVTVGPPARLAEAAEVLSAVDQAGSLRHVLLSTAGSVPAAPALQDVTTVADLRPEFLDNALAALRLSSLPTVIWWRGGPPGTLQGVAALADRVILDVEDPLPLWPAVRALAGRTAVTDIRWARLTRWRAVMALMFDVPEVREASDGFDRLALSGTDAAQCRLFAGWLDASLGWKGRVAVSIEDDGGAAPLARVRLGGGEVEVRLELLENRVCLATEARRGSRTLAARVVSLGDPALPAVLSEELRIRSRDAAFERALDYAV